LSLLRPALLERSFFREGVADDPTNISSVLRGTGKDCFACPVGYWAKFTTHAGWCDFRQSQKSLVDLPKRPLMAGHGLHPQRGHRLPRLRRENQANQV